MRRSPFPSALILSAAVFAGCSGDPRAGRLSVGDSVLFVDDEDSIVYATIPKDRVVGDKDWALIPVGLKARVVSDVAPLELGMREGDRPTTVLPLEGSETAGPVVVRRRNLTGPAK